MRFLFEEGTTDTTQTVTPGQQGGSKFLFETPQQAVKPPVDALKKNPDKEAKLNDVSKLTGIPKSAVRVDNDNIESQLMAEQIQQTTEDTPVTNDWMHDPRNAAIAHDDADALSTFERLSRALESGELTVKLGFAGTALRHDPTNEKHKLLVNQLKHRLEQSGYQGGEGFVSMLSEAANILGMQKEILTRPEAVRNITGATGLGAGAGSLFFGVGALPGAGAGLAAGIIGQSMSDSYVIEGGNAYVEMLDLGIDPEAASLLSHGVGVMNAALETAGMIPILKPFGEAGKRLFKEGIKKAVLSNAIKSRVAKFVGQYGQGVAAEVITEVTQEMVNVVAEELGKEFTDADLKAATPEEIGQRLQDIAEKTFKGMLVLGAPGPSINLATQYGNVRKAENNKKVLDKMHEALMDSKLNKRSPDALADLASKVMDVNDVKSVYINGETFQKWVAQGWWSEQQDMPTFMNNVGISDIQLQEAMALGTDIKIDGDKFGRYVLTDPNFTSISDDIRISEGGMTPAEATQFKQAGLDSQIQDLIDQQGEQDVTETDSTIDVAQQELGLGKFFDNAKEAGFTDKQYNDYLNAIERGTERAKTNQQEKELKQEQRKLTAEWKKAEQHETAIANEELSNQPVYQATNAVGAVRLDRSQVEDIVKSLGVRITDLPTQSNNRQIYTTNNNEESIDVEQHAETYGYQNAEEMIEDMITSPRFNDAVTDTVNQRMSEKFGDVKNGIQRIIEARKSLHNDDQASVLVSEVNALRSLNKEDRITLKQLRQSAKLVTDTLTIRDITQAKFLSAQKRLAFKAKQALRKGDISAASQYKFQQAVNFEAFRQADKVQQKVEKDKKKLAKFNRNNKTHKNIPHDYLSAIRELLAGVNLSNRKIDDKKSVSAIAGSKVEPVNVWDKFKGSNKQFYKDMKLSEWDSLVDTVTEIAHKGRQINKTRKQLLDDTVEGIVSEIKSTIQNNVKPKDKVIEEDRGRWANAKRNAKELLTMTLNMDTITRILDGHKDLGPVYRNTKGRIDQALSQGYHEGQVGYLRRERIESENISKLFEVFTEQEKKDINKLIKIPGLNRRLSHHTVLATLLNSGNDGNIQAMLEGRNYTQEELDAIWDYASEKDWQFAQSVWDYLDSFWNEVTDTTKRRTNTVPKRVEPREIVTKHGKFKGGYYPIRYDKHSSQATMFHPDTVEEMMDNVRYGNFTASHTAQGHLKARTSPGVANVSMDLFSLNNHVDQLIYDIEVGDAIADFYKIWFNKDTKQTFLDSGLKHYWDYGELWLRDAITQEIGADNALEQALRWLRTGFTVSKLAFNVGVSVSQIAGLSQTSVILGRKHTWAGIRTFLGAPMTGPDSIFNVVSRQSGFMEVRQDTWNKDIIDAQTQLSRHNTLDKLTPGRSAHFIRDAAFWGIKKMQMIVDMITWLGGYSKGIEQFNDHAQAIQYADRAVSRSQASGVFTERTAFERGTVSKKLTQTELIRSFTPLISYFAAKFNIAYERTKDTNFLNPANVAVWSWDMITLYAVDALIAGLLTGQIPFDDDDDETVTHWLAVQTGSSVITGVPLLREFASEVRGYPSGGVSGNLLAYFKKAYDQTEQGEIDEAFLKSYSNLMGMFFRVPSSLINKEMTNINRVNEGDDVSPAEWVFGPRYKK